MTMIEVSVHPDAPPTTSVHSREGFAAVILAAGDGDLSIFVHRDNLGAVRQLAASLMDACDTVAAMTAAA